MFDLLTFIIKVNHQCQVTEFAFFKILDLANVRIDTKIKCLACIQPETRKVIQLICVTLSFKVNRQGHVIEFNIFDILDLKNVRIETKINFVSCLQPEIRKVMQKGVWPWFSRSCNKDRIFSLSPLDSLTPRTYPWEIFSKKFGRECKNPGWGLHQPPLGVFGWRNTLGVCGLMGYDQPHLVFLIFLDQGQAMEIEHSQLLVRGCGTVFHPKFAIFLLGTHLKTFENISVQ